MSFVTDLRVLYHLVLKPVRGTTHAERLESFYSQQAGDYDAFRKKLLPGREELLHLIPFEDGQSWVDLGGGTGANLEFIPQTVERLREVSIVDLSPSLLQQAEQRIRHRHWSHVETVRADATRFEPFDQVDVVTCSYSLTMIPDWFAAVDQAWRMLKPGGVFAAVDFYVSRKHVEGLSHRHNWFTRTFWPGWFANDNVFLSPDHVPYLQRRFDTIALRERVARLPYLPFSRVPYYLFIGQKPVDNERLELDAVLRPTEHHLCVP